MFLHGKKSLQVLFALFMVSLALCFFNDVNSGTLCSASPTVATEQAPLKIKALLLPKFEVGEMSGDAAGEAQYYYDGYFQGAQAYEVAGCLPGHKLYVNADGLALYVTGSGKANAVAGTCSVLKDGRFDFSDAYIISTGCAGTAYGFGVMGDVFIVTETVDYDLAHRADIRDFKDKTQTITWFPEKMFNGYTHYVLNTELADRVYALVKDTGLATTERTQRFMAGAFPGEAWAQRLPKVLQGTTVTSDNYWKGIYDHHNAAAVCSFYQCRQPFAVSEMEDNAIACTLAGFGMLDRLIIIRDAVNMDVFMHGDSPEYSWGSRPRSLVDADSTETADIFTTAMENNFKVGKIVIDAILSGRLEHK